MGKVRENDRKMGKRAGEGESGGVESVQRPAFYNI